MDRLFSRELPARKAHAIVLEELAADEAQFRHNVDGSDITIHKEKADHFEEMSV